MSNLTKTQKETVFSYIDQNFDESVKAIQRLVRLPSVKTGPEEGAPFGKGIAVCAKAAADLCRDLGYATKELDGYAVLADVGRGEEMLGVLCHLDVVPEGAGWQYPPFGAEIADGRIYGRGVMDDKGPAVCALYAIKALQQAGIPFRRRVRVLLGCDEESGWACIDRYKETESDPDLCFSPDGHYPLVFAERTIYQATFTLPYGANTVKICCGERANVVPGEGSAWVDAVVTEAELPKWEGATVTCTPENGGTKIDVSARAAHASTPDEGVSALLYLLAALNSLTIEDPVQAGAIKAMADAFGRYYHGEGFGLDYEDQSGRITVSPGILNWDEQGLTLTIDLRIPLTLDVDTVQQKLDAALRPAGILFEQARGENGHCVPLDSELVTTLMEVYRETSGDLVSQPLAIGGGTYARAFENGVAFGCERIGEPMLAHMPNEYMTLEDVRFHTRMIAMAILKLACQEV